MKKKTSFFVFALVGWIFSLRFISISEENRGELIFSCFFGVFSLFVFLYESDDIIH